MAPLAIDHVLIPVDDLAAAAAMVEARHGLASIAGGRHPGWGTENRIIPLGEAYLELIAVVEPDVAATSAFGRWIVGAPAGKPLGWAVRTDVIEAVARRLGLKVTDGSRTTAAGDVLRWRSTGVDIATGEPGLPFFIEWGDGVPLPGTAPVEHPSGPAALRRLALSVDVERLGSWLGPHDLPLSVTNGRSGMVSVTLARGEDESAFEVRSQ
ncbi:MAG: VOC family protein [Chloroflexota bacterium]